MKRFLKINVWVYFLVSLLPFMVDAFVNVGLRRMFVEISFIAYLGYYLLVYEVCNENGKLRESITFYLLLLLVGVFDIIRAIFPMYQSGINEVEDVISNAGMIIWLFIIYTDETAYIRYTEGESGLHFKNYAVLFILFFFLPIGIWTIHKRLQKEYLLNNSAK